MVTYQVSLGRSLAVEPRTRQQKNASSSSSLVSVKYNFKPPSISSSSPGLLHVEESKGRDNSSNPQWTLEFAGTGQTAHGFSGHQTAAKDVDCVLVWDSKTNTYVLDRLASTFSLKYDRGHSSLTPSASQALESRARPSQSISQETSRDTKRESSQESLSNRGARDTMQHEVGVSSEARSQRIDDIDEEEHDRDGPGASQEPAIDDDEENFDDEELARQIEMSFDAHAQQEKEREAKEAATSANAAASPRPTTGLGLIDEDNGLVIVEPSHISPPRRPPQTSLPTRAVKELAKEDGRGTRSPAVTATRPVPILGSPALGAHRITPAVSPSSAVNSPRIAVEPLSGANTNWKPPAQRGPVRYDDDDDDDDDEDEDEDEDEEEDDEEEEEDGGGEAGAADEEMDEGDLEDFARQLDNSFSEPAVNAVEATAETGNTKARGRSSRGNK